MNPEVEPATSNGSCVKPGTAVCSDCPAKQGEHWRQRGLYFRRELRRHDVPDTCRRMAEAICDISLGLGLEEVMVPSLKYFCALTGLEKQHVHDAIRRLHLMRVIRVRTHKGQPHYQIREDSDNWKASPRELMLDADERMEQIRALNGLDPKGAVNFFDPRAGLKKECPAVTKYVTQPVTTSEVLPDLD